MSLRELAKHISSDASNLSKIELGKKVPTPELVARILGALHTAQEEYERILDLARNASEPNGLTVGMPGITKQLAGSIESEQESSAIHVWSPMMVPGLLQTSEHYSGGLNTGQ